MTKKLTGAKDTNQLAKLITNLSKRFFIASILYIKYECYLIAAVMQGYQ
jgi:hypothetical protein